MQFKYLKMEIYRKIERERRMMSEEGEEERPAILYQCLKCGALVKSSELELGIRCPYCRYRVLKKVKPPIVKHVKAR